MALLFMDGFDAGVQDPAWSGGSITTTTSGRYRSAMNLNMGYNSFRNLYLPASAQMIIGFAFFWSTENPDMNNTRLPSTFGDGGATQHLNLNLNGSQLVLRRGSTTIATASINCPRDVWHYIEMKSTVASTGGICVVRQNGQEVINFNGNTKNGGTNNTIDVLSFGMWNSTARMDDIYVCNSTGTINNDFLGDSRVETLMPNENGASSQWVGSDGNSVDNYLLVDENPPSSTDYVESATVGAQDLYGMENLTITNGNVRGLQPMAWAAKSDSGDAFFRTVMRGADGTVVTGATHGLSVTYTQYPGTIRETQPNGAAWTITDANNTQVGVEAV